MKALEELRKHGYKITPPRMHVLQLLARHPHDEHQGPIAVQEIVDDLRKEKITVDLVSVYRTLELLVKLGIVSEIEFGEGKKRYELTSTTSHHHHLVCKECGTIEDIAIPLEEKILADVTRSTKFKIDAHSLEFIGVCYTCQIGGTYTCQS